MSGSATARPWVAVLGDVPYAEFENEAWTVNGTAGSICTLDGPKDQNEANARLIAAAPDLLNELEASAKMLRTLVEVAEDIRLEGAPIIRERLVSVEAAIARARGEQA